MAVKGDYLRGCFAFGFFLLGSPEYLESAGASPVHPWPGGPLLIDNIVICWNGPQRDQPTEVDLVGRSDSLAHSIGDSSSHCDLFMNPS